MTTEKPVHVDHAERAAAYLAAATKLLPDPTLVSDGTQSNPALASAYALVALTHQLQELSGEAGHLADKLSTNTSVVEDLYRKLPST